MKPKKSEFIFSIEKNSFTATKDGKIKFKNGLVITDNTEQRNGTKYDIPTMDISEFPNKLTANHSSKIEDVIGSVAGLRKVANRKVVIEEIQFAVDKNALAQYAFDMFNEGYLTDFSIETFGPWPNDDGIYENSKLIGLSLVVVGNNRSATVNEAEVEKFNQIAFNSLKASKQMGLDTSIVENNYLCYDSNNKKEEIKDMFVTIKNSREFGVTLKYKNAAGDDCTATLKPGETLDVSSDQEKSLNAVIANAVAPKAEEPKAEKKEVDFEAALNKALAPMIEKVEKLEKSVFDNSAKEPSFKRPARSPISISKNTSADLEALNYKQRHQVQINAAWEVMKKRNFAAQKEWDAVNEFHYEKLMESGKVDNSMTIGDFGNFVISPELLTDIEGFRSNFKAFLAKINFQDTLSLQMAWLKRDGDINMTEVETCDDGANGNLKPVSEYEADFNVSNLKELAAVTPVCNAATRFLAVDMLGDIAKGYRTDYDRKLAQIAIARFQQSVNRSGNKVPFNASATIGATALNSIISVASEVAEQIENGIWVFNYKTYFEILRRAMVAGINTDSGFGMFSSGAVKQMVGYDYVVVPNELMPSLNTNETKTIIVEGVSVTIDQAMFFVDPSTFSGRTSGGLQYDLSTEASYEVASVVKSAFQRNELVVRGSFFRGAAVRDDEKVASMYAAGVS